MKLTERLRRALKHTRGFTDTILGEIRLPGDWIRRPEQQGNHAMWIAGHLGLATNSFIGFVDESKMVERDDLAKLFAKGTQPIDDLAAYPAPSEVAAFLTERGNTFIGLLDGLTDDDLEREVPGGPAFMYDVGAVFQMAAWHEALHAGQLTVIHRLIGEKPFTDR